MTRASGTWHGTRDRLVTLRRRIASRTIAEPPQATRPQISSFLCRSAHFETDWYRRWATEIAAGGADLHRFGADFAVTFAQVWAAMRFEDGSPEFKHRKMWEWCVIAQALTERGRLTPGAHGIGFAVGHEPLTSLFAGHGAHILASDLVEPGETSWNTSGQQTSEREHLWWPNLVPERAFQEHVTFRSLDMRDLSSVEPQSQDFAWSSCSMEHLGSLEAGLAFVEGSADLLKPGGVAVHTTEFNLSSETATLETGWTVLYRATDLLALSARLAARGARLEALNLDPGQDPDDLRFDEPPYYSHGRQHVSLKIDGYVCTSLALIVVKDS